MKLLKKLYTKNYLKSKVIKKKKERTFLGLTYKSPIWSYRTHIIENP